MIYVSDFDMDGSGYLNIGVALCSRLAARGMDVIALGLGYKGDEHPYPFHIVPTNLTLAQAMIHNFLTLGTQHSPLVVALDIPLHEAFLSQPYRTKLPYIGIFPIEGDPLCMKWASILFQMDKRLIISEFGVEEAAKVGVNAEHLPVAIDRELWPEPTAEERALIRKSLNVGEDDFVILTVAANQERKFLSRAMEGVADFVYGRTVQYGATMLPDDKAHPNVRYWMVTKLNSVAGWKLDELAMSLGIIDHTTFWPHGLRHDQLRALYAAADLFLAPSKAEGCCLPILEAMASNVPVAATRCTAIEEHLNDGRGVFIEPDYIMVDVWGNTNRYLAGRASTVAAIERAFCMGADERREMLQRAKDYIALRNWDASLAVLEEAIMQVTKNGKA